MHCIPKQGATDIQSSRGTHFYVRPFVLKFKTQTTLRKQMRNLYGEGFSESARKQLSNVVLGNLIDGTLEVLKTLPVLKLELESENARNAVAVVKAVQVFPNFLSAELAKALLDIQDDKSFKTVCVSFSPRALPWCTKSA